MHYQLVNLLMTIIFYLKQNNFQEKIIRQNQLIVDLNHYYTKNSVQDRL